MLSLADVARVRVAVEDHAAEFYGGPMNFGRSDAVRYTTETYCAKLPFREAWAAAEAVLSTRPELLSWDKSHRDANAAARTELAEDASDRAHKLFDAGDVAGALAAIDDGERIAPDHRIGRWHTWDDLRRIIREATA